MGVGEEVEEGVVEDAAVEAGVVSGGGLAGEEGLGGSRGVSGGIGAGCGFGSGGGCGGSGVGVWWGVGSRGGLGVGSIWLVVVLCSEPDGSAADVSCVDAFVGGESDWSFGTGRK